MAQFIDGVGGRMDLVAELKTTIATLTAQRDAAYALIAIRSDERDAALSERAVFRDAWIAAEKVCEAAEQVERYMMNEALDAALTEWRRTKDA